LAASRFSHVAGFLGQLSHRDVAFIGPPFQHRGYFAPSSINAYHRAGRDDRELTECALAWAAATPRPAVAARTRTASSISATALGAHLVPCVRARDCGEAAAPRVDQGRRVVGLGLDLEADPTLLRPFDRCTYLRNQVRPEPDPAKTVHRLPDRPHSGVGNDHGGNSKRQSLSMS